MRNKHFYLLMLSVLGLQVSSVEAACSLDIVSVQSLNLSWSTSGQTIQRDVVVTRAGSPLSQCRFFHLAITTGQAGVYNRYLLNNPAQLNYNFYRDAGLSNILRDHPSVTNSNHVIDDSFPGSSTSKTVSFFLNYAIPPYLSTLKQGLYNDNPVIRLYKGKWNAPNGVMDSMTLNPNLTVPTYIALSLIESGGPFNAADTYQLLNFGTLSTGQSLGFDIKVEANISYNVTMSSMNNGKMKRTGGTEQIDYSMQVNAVAYNLSGSASTPVIVASHLGTTSQGGFQHPVLVQIGSVANKTAGSYSDTITIETVAQ